MNYANSENQKYHQSTKHKKKRLNQDQIRLLEATFDGNKKLEPELKLHLARELDMPPRQIAIWYQNKRARWKNQSLELDYNGLQGKLESTLMEKKQLEKEVKHLQEELHKARNHVLMLEVDKQAALYPPPIVSSIDNSGCCDEGGSGGLYDDVSGSWVVNGGGGSPPPPLQYDEVYDPNYHGLPLCGSRRWVMNDRSY